LPAGPLFLGGSTLSLTTADPQGRTASVQVSVAGSVVSQAQGPLGETRHSLPLQPEGAAVRADTSVVTTDQGTLTAHLDGTLSRFASAPRDAVPLAADVIGGFAGAGSTLLLARDGGGGNGTLEVRSSLDGQLTASAALSGRPVAAELM